MDARITDNWLQELALVRGGNGGVKEGVDA